MLLFLFFCLFLSFFFYKKGTVKKYWHDNIFTTHPLWAIFSQLQFGNIRLQLCPLLPGERGLAVATGGCRTPIPARTGLNPSLAHGKFCSLAAFPKLVLLLMCLGEWDPTLQCPSAGFAAVKCRSRSRARGRAWDGVGVTSALLGCPLPTRHRQRATARLGNAAGPWWVPTQLSTPRALQPPQQHPLEDAWWGHTHRASGTDPKVLLCKGAGCPCSACLHPWPPRWQAERWHRRETPRRCANTAPEKPSSRPPYL